MRPFLVIFLTAATRTSANDPETLLTIGKLLQSRGDYQGAIAPLWRASQVQGFDGRDDALEGVRASYAALKQPWGFYAEQARLLLRHAMLDKANGGGAYGGTASPAVRDARAAEIVKLFDQALATPHAPRTLGAEVRTSVPQQTSTFFVSFDAHAKNSCRGGNLPVARQKNAPC